MALGMCCLFKKKVASLPHAWSSKTHIRRRVCGAWSALAYHSLILQESLASKTIFDAQGTHGNGRSYIKLLKDKQNVQILRANISMV